MKKVTLVFPGQGSQYVGMGKNGEGDESFQLYEKANEVLGYSLSKLCFEGPEDDLKLTQNAQPAIVTHSTALFRKVKKLLDEKGVEVSGVLGHSVGEYSALVAAGVLSFEDAVKAVHLRGKYMQEAVPVGKGKMVAIMKLPEELVRRACEAASEGESRVMPANFNDPNQIVISGDAVACDRAVEWLKENTETRYRAIPLKVSAPFHSSLMEPAADKLKEAFGQFEWSALQTPYIANIDAKEYATSTPVDVIKENLVKQVAGSVLWTQSIANLPDDTVCLEVGPGKVLAGLIKKINPNIKTISLDQEESWSELKEILG